MEPIQYLGESKALALLPHSKFLYVASNLMPMDAALKYPLVIIDERVNTTRFACDLEQCKGACCTLKGGVGAPITQEEITAIEGAMSAALPYLSDRSRKIITEEGFVDDEFDALRCIEERDCVFVFYEGDVAKCSLEKAFFDGKTSFRKPISCHLFPIRRTTGMYDHLRVEYFPECESGYEKGAAENIPLLTSAKDALIRAYGEDWYAHITNTND